MNEFMVKFVFPNIIQDLSIDRIIVEVPIDATKDWTLDNGNLYDSSDNLRSVFHTIRDYYCVFDAAIITEYYNKRKHPENEGPSDSLFSILQLTHHEIHKSLDTKLYAFIATLFLYNWYIHENNKDAENKEQIHAFIQQKYNKHITFMFRNSKIDVNADSDMIILQLEENLQKINECRNSISGPRCFAIYCKLDITSGGHYADWNDCFSLMKEKWASKNNQRCISISEKGDAILYSISGIEPDKMNQKLAQEIENVIKAKNRTIVIRRSYTDLSVKESVFCYVDKLCSHSDVRFYYTTYQHLLEEGYLTTRAYNRLFTCCERKLFGEFANSHGEIIVAAQCCSICEKVGQSPEYSGIHVRYLISQNNSAINTTDWYNTLPEEVRKKYLKVIDNRVYCLK